ncbi:MAG: precorrin-6Y C5,15-methyltransferase (decarboxylating) subunit CbiT [Nitrosopumilus sp. D6]|nr:MAG: precorrin-6Y C5,15-methyltransferase (decarboxylating) subunit CbiT [Nitrosopumilus sp. D6]
MWDFKTPGIPDELFERADKVPITKEEVRAVQISKARLRPGYTIYDVGCGSGSISVEAGLQAESGRVIAIDRDDNAISLTRKNVEKFGLTNVSLVHGDALKCIKELDMADAIFVGGTGGDTAGIVRLCQDKLRPGRRIVIGTILIETLHAVLQELKELQFDSVDITQVTVSKSKKTSTGTMMLARNPVTIISATRV